MMGFEYSSQFAPYIESLIREKRACGYIYSSEARILKNFDSFAANNSDGDGVLSRDLVMAWAVQRPTEGVSARNNRVCSVRQLAIHMISLGENAYIARRMRSVRPPDPYVLTQTELTNFFRTLDGFVPPQYTLKRFSAEYSVLFRMYYCCGLRLSEGLKLRRGDVDLEEGILMVRQSKGDKDREAFMSTELTDLCRRYEHMIDAMFSDREWFFPGRIPDKPFSKSSIDAVFKTVWQRIPGVDTHNRRIRNVGKLSDYII